MADINRNRWPISSECALALYGIGYINSPYTIVPTIEIRHRHRDFPDINFIIDDIVRKFSEYVMSSRDPMSISVSNQLLDPRPFILEIEREMGHDVARIALEFLGLFLEAQNRSFWSSVRRVEWSNVLELSELFENESLSTLYGNFFDQRFIDYLYRNFEDIDKINWRKFEELVSEYFSKEGFYVDIGPGRNDNGIDARVWPSHKLEGSAPQMLIQCKRQKNFYRKSGCESALDRCDSRKCPIGINSYY